MRPRHPAFLALACALRFAVNVDAAADAPAPSRSGVFELMAGDLEASSVTFGAGALQFPGSHLRSDSTAYSVEARVAPNFILARATDLLPGAMMITATPKFVVRRSDGLASNPVLTPGYLPAVALFYSPFDSVVNAAPGVFIPLQAYYSVTLRHHSNGQSGAFLAPDGRLNHVDGSFSLWSVSATAHLHGGWAWLPEYKALRVERFYFKEGALDAFYPDWAATLSLRTAPRALGLVPGRARLLTDVEWMPRKRNDVPDGLKPVPLSASLTAAWFPGKISHGTTLDFAIFARAYAGHDDYNIQFDREVYSAELGLMFGNLAFGNGAP